MIRHLMKLFLKLWTRSVKALRKIFGRRKGWGREEERGVRGDALASEEEKELRSSTLVQRREL